MSKFIVTTITGLLLASTTVHGQIEQMSLVGKGNVYYLGFIKVYDAFLFADPTINVENILEPSISKCLKLEYDVTLTPENFIEGANKVLARQHSTEKLNSLSDEIKILHDSYQGVEKGDNYELCYDADSEVTTLALNGTVLSTIDSALFSSLYFGIWLKPENPLDKKLQRSLVSSRASE